MKILAGDTYSEEYCRFLLKNLLIHFAVNSILLEDQNTQNLLHNFSSIISKKHKLIKSSYDFDSLFLELINLFTFRNSVKVRMMMKKSNLFKIRDQILLNVVRVNTDQNSLAKLLSSFSFESISNTSQFKDSLALANMVNMLVKSDNEDLQLFICKLFKFELVNEDNQKEIVKLVNE